MASGVEDEDGLDRRAVVERDGDRAVGVDGGVVNEGSPGFGCVADCGVLSMAARPITSAAVRRRNAGNTTVNGGSIEATLALRQVLFTGSMRLLLELRKLRESNKNMVPATFLVASRLFAAREAHGDYPWETVPSSSWTRVLIWSIMPRTSSSERSLGSSIFQS